MVHRGNVRRIPTYSRIIVCCALAAAAALAGVTAAPVTAAVVSGHPTPTWQTNGRVRAIAVVGHVVYLGGKFTTVRPPGAAAGVDDVPRHHAAAINLRNGRLLAWNPNVNGTVRALVVRRRRVYLGGSFTSVGGVARHDLAAVDTSTGEVVRSWRAGANGAVMTLATAGKRIFVGGHFTRIDGSGHSFLAALRAPTGAVAARFTAHPDAAVLTSTVTHSGHLVIGGSFTHVNGGAQGHIAAVSPTTGARLRWASHTPYALIDVSSDRDGVYAAEAGAGGNFAAFNPATGRLLWRGGTDGNVQAIASLAGMVYAGGHYENYCGPHPGAHTCNPAVRRLKMLAVAGRSGGLQAWAPAVNSVLGVHALAPAAGRLVMGGDFTKVAGIHQQGFAVFEPA